ncbi:hypothetical protein [Roseomonas haemaphysalidis]|uniref:Uncharacterized protein n=1 Tax=Roseomonas haemaphysalidis TaxID=2768162 RepID=A0ABS3KKX4_9PROT|nr:hypothetical protein [Roseomonas haemaphysalidis]MBO1078102.1 hypothetical protein [Roseomonas haemaphysalidis]
MDEAFKVVILAMLRRASPEVVFEVRQVLGDQAPADIKKALDDAQQAFLEHEPN